MNYESATRSVLVLVWVVLVCLPGKEGSATRSVLVLVWFIPLSSLPLGLCLSWSGWSWSAWKEGALP
jgi:hypothetical protein